MSCNCCKSKCKRKKNNYLRTLAELENYRKRAQRELQESRQYAEIDLLLDLLRLWIIWNVV